MRILVLSKRQYLGKDLLSDRYWRLYELPRALAIHGHDVRVILLSYRIRDQGVFVDEGLPNLVWHSINAWGGSLSTGVIGYYKLVSETLDKFQPDVVWASSDALHAVFAWKICRRRRVPYVIDLYDNYESFGLARLPGMTAMLRSACRSASGLTVISRSLVDFVVDKYRYTGRKLVLGNAVPSIFFKKGSKKNVRELLGLPVDGRLVGTVGAIHRNRGISVLFEAFLEVVDEDPSLWLVFAGPRDETPKKYTHPQIIDLGNVVQRFVPSILSALDILVICNLDSDFGRYCFPQKYHEAVACEVPVIAARVGDMKSVLSHRPERLFSPSNSGELAQCIRAYFKSESIALDDGVKHPSWDDMAICLERFLSDIAS